MTIYIAVFKGCGECEGSYVIGAYRNMNHACVAAENASQDKDCSRSYTDIEAVELMESAD